MRGASGDIGLYSQSWRWQIRLQQPISPAAKGAEGQALILPFAAKDYMIDCHC